MDEYGVLVFVILILFVSTMSAIVGVGAWAIYGFESKRSETDSVQADDR